MAWSLYKREVEKFGHMVKEILDNKYLTYDKKIYSAIDLFYTYYDKSPSKFSFILLSQYIFPREYKVNKQLNPYYQMEQLLKHINKKSKTKDYSLLTGMIFGLILEPARMRAFKEIKGKLKVRTNVVSKAVINLINSSFT